MPSGLNATRRTIPSWPVRACKNFPDGIAHNFSRPWPLDAARAWPSRLKVTVLTSP